MYDAEDKYQLLASKTDHTQFDNVQHRTLSGTAFIVSFCLFMLCTIAVVISVGAPSLKGSHDDVINLMSEDFDYYEVLEVSRTASTDEIKRAYRKLALKWHPDKNNGDSQAFAESMFNKVSEAYEGLSDEERRRRYDHFGRAGVRSGGGGFSPFNMNDAFTMFNAFFGGVSPFAALFGGLASGGFGTSTNTREENGRTIRTTMQMVMGTTITTEEEFVNGAWVPLSNEDKRPPAASTYCLVGDFNGWDVKCADQAILDETTSPFSVVLKITIGSSRREEFQILGDGTWEKRIFPAMDGGQSILRPGAPPSKAAGGGPEDGHDRNWAIEGDVGTPFHVKLVPETGVISCELVSPATVR